MMNGIPQTQSYMCPCCQGFIGEAAPIEMVVERVPTGQQKSILEVLSRRLGRSVAKASLMGILFDDRADGGPDRADLVFNVQLSNLRKRIERHGWSIVTAGGGRGSPTFYRLVPTEAGQ